jgi:hypothetical protein
MINAKINELKKNQSVSIFFLQKNVTAVQKKTLHKQQTNT